MYTIYNLFIQDIKSNLNSYVSIFLENEEDFFIYTDNKFNQRF